MKKIIAVVLAMVMTMALCVTAFAATEYKGYDKKGEFAVDEDSVFTYETVKASRDKDVDEGWVAHYWVLADDDTYGYYVAADAKAYDLKLTTPGKAALYLSEALNDGYYDYKATEFKAIGEGCGQLDEDTDETYYTVTTVDDETLYFVADENGASFLLVNGKVVAAEELADAELNAHTWEASKYDAAGKNVVEYTCKDCKTVAKVYATKDAATADGMKVTEELSDGTLIGFNFTAKGAAATTTTTTTAGSPKTFDAGVAMYAGMALMSVAGSAVVIGKKKEF